VGGRTPGWFHPLSILLLNTYSVISPLLYAYRSKRVQRDFRKVGFLLWQLLMIHVHDTWYM
jgi:hypothetical protein